MRFGLVAFVVTMATCLRASVAAAQSEPPKRPVIEAPMPGEQGPTRASAPPEHPRFLAPATGLKPGEERPLDSYDGRPKRTTTAEDLLWIPRVILFPVYALDEYVLRKPLGAAVIAIDKHGVIEKVTNFFTFGGKNFGLVPTGFIDFGFRPSFGIYYFYNDFLTAGNKLQASLSTGGSNWLKASFADRIPLQFGRTEPTRYDPTTSRVVTSYLQLEVFGVNRPDVSFWGIGYKSKFANEGVLELRSVGGGARVRSGFLKGSFLETWVTLRRSEFNSADCEADPLFGQKGHTDHCLDNPISDEVAKGVYALPPGFGGYALVRAGGKLFLDSRRKRPYNGSGVAFDAHGELSSMFSGETHGDWISYGGSLGGFLDLTGHHRMLGLTIDARMLDTIGPNVVVPFMELIGGFKNDYVPEDDLIRGFKPGRLLGKSSATATLSYEWPIWVFVDATLQASVGNVFDEHFRDFKFDRNRFSFVGGFTQPDHRDHALSFMLGFGTRPFDEGGSPESIRLLIGGTTGF